MADSEPKGSKTDVRPEPEAQAQPLPSTADEERARRHEFVSDITEQQKKPPVGAGATVETGWPPVSGPSLAATRLEVYLAATGLALVGFMMMHLCLLFSSVFGSNVMDALAGFLEGYYLLHIGAPIVVLLLLGHIVFAVRKVPTTAGQQMALIRHMKTLKHFDTWMWFIQIVSGVAILVLIAIHLWVVLTDLPISAAKSGGRVAGQYLWFYIPFLVFAEAHASAGLYRMAVKWDFIQRKKAHRALRIWTVSFLVLGAVVLATFYMIGGGA